MNFASEAINCAQWNALRMETAVVHDQVYTIRKQMREKYDFNSD